jgi:transposase
MRTLGSNRQVDERRQRGLALLFDGLTAKQVASRVGTSVRTVQRWAKAAQTGKPRERQRPGPKPRLKGRQVQRLARQLQRGARAHGYAEDHWTLERKNINGHHVVAFLKKLLRVIKGPMVWIWDNHRIHIHKLVKAFIAQPPRLHVFHFPSYAPELNPVEGVWTQAKQAIAGSAPHHIQELHRNVYAALKHIANAPRHLRACCRISKLPPIK